MIHEVRLNDAIFHTIFDLIMFLNSLKYYLLEKYSRKNRLKNARMSLKITDTFKQSTSSTLELEEFWYKFYRRYKD